MEADHIEPPQLQRDRQVCYREREGQVCYSYSIDILKLTRLTLICLTYNLSDSHLFVSTRKWRHQLEDCHSTRCRAHGNQIIKTAKQLHGCDGITLSLLTKHSKSVNSSTMHSGILRSMAVTFSPNYITDQFEPV